MTALESLNFKSKKALVRVDFNVPLNEKRAVTDASRIVASKPTIDYILKNGGCCILLSHLGRPKGFSKELSLSNIVSTVEKVLERSVKFIPDCIGDGVEKEVKKLKKGEILLLENVRFYEEETKGDDHFAKKLSFLGDYYINDAFGAAHRAHASTTKVASFFEKGKKCFGKLFQKEIEVINTILKTGEKPFLAILGGAKVSSKITIIENILPKINSLIIGGGMAYTFIKAQGGNIGDSICEDNYINYTKELIEKCKFQGVDLYLPKDVIIADSFSNNAKQRKCDIYNIPHGWQGLDTGEVSLKNFKKVVLASRTILWNGPLGVFEFEKFSAGTVALGKFIIESTKKGAFSLVGGGDSVAAAKQFGFEKQVSYVSTGGGAMLESLEGKVLPGVKALEN